MNFRKILGLCDHKFDVINTMQINRVKSGSMAGLLYIIKCVHCGKVKTKRVMVD